MIYLPEGCAFALLVGAARQVIDVLNERALECSVQDGLLILYEDADTLLLQIVDDTRTEIDNLFVDIIDELHHALLYVLLLLWREISKEELLGLFCRQNLEFVCILDIHNLVTDIIGCLNEIDKGIAGIFHRTFGCGKLKDAQFAGNTLVVCHLALEETKLAFVSGKIGGEWVFDDACQCAVRHDKATFAAPLEMMREQAKGIGVTFEMNQVVPLLRRDAIARLWTNVILQELPIALAEIGPNGLLTTVSERRVAKVVRQTGGTDDIAKFCKMCAIEFGMFLENDTANIIAQAPPHTTHLETVCKAIVYKNAARQRENLGFVLQATEGRRKDKSVIVALELRTVITPLLHFLLAKAFAGKQLLPLHHLCHGILHLSVGL